MVYIVNGCPESGKGEFVNFVEQYSEAPIAKYSIIDPIKQIFKDIGQESKQKTEKYRKALSDVKLALDEYSDYTFQDVAQFVREMENLGKTCFIDMRSPEDIQRATNELGAKTIYVERIVKRSQSHIPQNKGDIDAFETDKTFYDYIIDNSGNLKDLEGLATAFVVETGLSKGMSYNRSTYPVMCRNNMKSLCFTISPRSSHCKDCEYRQLIDNYAICRLNGREINSETVSLDRLLKHKTLDDSYDSQVKKTYLFDQPLKHWTLDDSYDSQIKRKTDSEIVYKFYKAFKEADGSAKREDSVQTEKETVHLQAKNFVIDGVSLDEYIKRVIKMNMLDSIKNLAKEAKREGNFS